MMLSTRLKRTKFSYIDVVIGSVVKRSVKREKICLPNMIARRGGESRGEEVKRW